MTKDRDFKQIVRERMVQTGEPYTLARATLEQEKTQAVYDAARREQQRLIGRFFSGEQLVRIPARRKARAGVLLEVLSRLEPGRIYSEPEVNEILGSVYEDFAYLRRELVNYRYVERAGGRYRVVAHAPARTAMEQQEIPAWEAVWLPDFVRGQA